MKLKMHKNIAVDLYQHKILMFMKIWHIFISAIQKKKYITYKTIAESKFENIARIKKLPYLKKTTHQNSLKS
jgi:hypothetical protein